MKKMYSTLSQIFLNVIDFGSRNTSAEMVLCVNVPPLGDEPFTTTAFIRPGLLTDRWEGRTALELLPHSTSKLTFQWSYFICHPQAPSWCITVILGLRHALLPPLSQPNHHHATQAVAAPEPHYSKGLSPPIFSHFLGARPPHFLSASVYPISQDANPSF